MKIRRLVVGMLLLDLLVLTGIAWAVPYRLTYTAPDPRCGRVAATWNGVPWVLDVAAGSVACGAYRCTVAGQTQPAPADVQLACYLDPNPAATVAPSALSNVIVVPQATALPGSPAATMTPGPLATQTATPVATRTSTPVPATTATASAACVPVAAWTGAANDYWGDPIGSSVVTAARQLVTVAQPFVPCGVTVRGYGELGATGTKAFELWREDLASRVDGGVASAALDVASALQPRDYVLGWPASVTVPAGRYFLRAAGPTTGGRWRWSATTPGVGGYSSNVLRGSTFVYVLYGRTAPAVTPTPIRTSSPARTATATPVRTTTPLPTATLVPPTPTSTPVPTSTATRTATPLPTLTPTPWRTTVPPIEPGTGEVFIQQTDGTVGRFQREVP